MHVIGEARPIGARRYMYRSSERPPHRFRSAKAAHRSDHVDTIARFLEPPSSRFHTQALDETCWRCPHFRREYACEVPRAHRDPFRQSRDRKIVGEMIRHPSLELTQRLAIG